MGSGRRKNQKSSSKTQDENVGGGRISLQKVTPNNPLPDGRGVNYTAQTAWPDDPKAQSDYVANPGPVGIRMPLAGRKSFLTRLHLLERLDQFDALAKWALGLGNVLTREEKSTATRIQIHLQAADLKLANGDDITEDLLFFENAWQLLVTADLEREASTGRPVQGGASKGGNAKAAKYKAKRPLYQAEVDRLKIKGLFYERACGLTADIFGVSLSEIKRNTHNKKS